MDFDSLDQYKIPYDRIKKLYNEGKKKIGVIFNLDEHWQSGSHWVALYADLEKGVCYYFDSYAVAPEKRVQNLMKRIGRFIKSDLNKEPTIDYNKTRHQKANSECGVYSMAFILRQLKGESFEDINSKRIPDEEINKCRKVYFS